MYESSNDATTHPRASARRVSAPAGVSVLLVELKSSFCKIAHDHFELLQRAKVSSPQCQPAYTLPRLVTAADSVTPKGHDVRNGSCQVDAPRYHSQARVRKTRAVRD